MLKKELLQIFWYEKYIACNGNTFSIYTTKDSTYNTQPIASHSLLCRHRLLTVWPPVRSNQSRHSVARINKCCLHRCDEKPQQHKTHLFQRQFDSSQNTAQLKNVKKRNYTFLKLQKYRYYFAGGESCHGNLSTVSHLLCQSWTWFFSFLRVQPVPHQSAPLETLQQPEVGGVRKKNNFSNHTLSVKDQTRC